MEPASLGGLRLSVLLEFRHDVFGEKLHRLALPRLVRPGPIKAGHEQSAKWADLFAEGDKLVEHRFRGSHKGCSLPRSLRLWLRRPTFRTAVLGDAEAPRRLMLRGYRSRNS